MKSFVASSLFLLGASAQYTFDCNHWSAYTVDVCYEYSSAYQYYFECNGTDALIFYTYSDGSCGTDSGDAWLKIRYEEDSDSTDLFQCDQGEACQYAILRYYSDGDCSGDTFTDGPLIVGQCYEGSSTSYELLCLGDDLLQYVQYSSSGDCTGVATTVTVDYSDYSDSSSYCYELICSHVSTDVTYIPETTQVEPIPDIDFVTGDWECNHYSFYTTGVCYNFFSTQYYVECNGTDKLSFYQFSDGSCGTNSASPSYVITYDESSDTEDLFECDNDDPCEYIIVRYYDDEDCSGDSIADGPLIPGVCYESSTSSYGIVCEGSELTVVTFPDEGDCTGDAVASTIDYEDYSDDLDGCYEVICEYTYPTTPTPTGGEPTDSNNSGSDSESSSLSIGSNVGYLLVQTIAVFVWMLK